MTRQLLKQRWVQFAIGPLLLVLLWQLAEWGGMTNRTILPAPLGVGRALCDLALHGSIFKDTFASVSRVATGFLIGAFCGAALGLTRGLWGCGMAPLRGIVEILRPIPPIAWIPLAILWFGLGTGPAVFIVSLGSFFPVFVNSYEAVGAVDQDHIDLARSLGASRARVTFDVILPASLPRVFTGLRIGLGVSWMSVIAAELVGAQSGLGYMIQLNRILLDTERIIAGMLVIGIVGLAMTLVLIYLERLIVPWARYSASSQ